MAKPIICVSSGGNFPAHDSGHDGVCVRCLQKVDGPQVSVSVPAQPISSVSSAPARPANMEEISKALVFAEFFYELRGLPPQGRDEKCAAWAEELAPLLVVHELEDLKKYLSWCLENEFWMARVYVPKNFAGPIDHIIGQYKTQLKQIAKKTNSAEG